MILNLTPEDESERKVVEKLNTDWLLYGEMHLTNAPNGHGLTRLDPKGITYKPTGDETKVGSPNDRNLG